ncbi:MAG TPA: hypothetical protein DCY13_03265 [Verrucomicrobiales bacterium]|nr:hypothetical protein [Verrucomicrobiales bacterium]
MNNHQDIKSGLLCFCLGVGVVLAIGAVSPPHKALGRFEIGGTGAHGMVIDTMTGQVWSKYFSPIGGSIDDGFTSPKVPTIP